MAWAIEWCANSAGSSMAGRSREARLNCIRMPFFERFFIIASFAGRLPCLPASGRGGLSCTRAFPSESTFVERTDKSGCGAGNYH